MKTTSAIRALVGCLALASCASPIQPATEGPELKLGNSGPVMPLDHPPVGGVDGGAGGGSGGPPSGGSTRLSVMQLKSSLPVVLGGPTWQIGTANGFDLRAVTLGQPDYIGVVDENLEPSPLYLKFMQDMARDGCNRAMAADVAQPVMANRSIEKFVALTDTVTSNRAAVDANLRYLRLAFHGIKVGLGDELPIAPLRKLFDDTVKAAAGSGAVTQAHVTEGWRTVCVALLTAPEYHLY